MSTHSVTLRGDSHDERLAAECLGRVLSRYFDALPDWWVTAMVWNEARKYTGPFGHSVTFTELDRLAARYGVLWDLDNFGNFSVSF